MANLFDLTGKNAVVIGGAGGIGQAIAEGYAEAGAKVLIASRREESLQRAQEEIKASTGITVDYATVDVTNEESIAALVATAEQKLGRIDILCCSQGLNKKCPTLEFDLSLLNDMLAVNVVGLMACVKHFGNHMAKNNYGKIVIVSSIRGKSASRNDGNIGYCISKGAVDMLIRQAAADLGKYHITVNGIAPTITETPMMSKLIEQRGGDEYRKTLAKSYLIPAPHVMAAPTDCVGPAIFFASSASDFNTAEVSYPTGGLSFYA